MSMGAPSHVQIGIQRSETAGIMMFEGGSERHRVFKWHINSTRARIAATPRAGRKLKMAAEVGNCLY